MVAVSEDLSAALCDAVHGSRKARADRHHATSERVPVLCFDDQMRVIALQGVLHQAKRPALASVRERAFERANDARVAEGRQTGPEPEPERDVRRQCPETHARAVTHPGMRTGLATRPGAPSPPPPRCG